jgi:filamentous hemagglutinin
MQIPNAVNAAIERSKLVDYLLNVDHPQGGSKARLLTSMGYSIADWPQLEADIRSLHLSEDYVEISSTLWGNRYEIVAPLTGPLGDTVMFRSVWQVDLGHNAPRLITMYPE